MRFESILRGIVRFRLVLVAGGLVTLACSSIYFVAERTQLRTAIHREIQAVADQKLRQLATWRDERMHEALFLRHAPAIAADIRALIAHPQSTEARRAVRAWLEAIKAGERYSAALVFDRTGALVLGVGAMPSGPDVLSEAALKTALTNREISLSDLHRNDGGPMELDIVVPILPANAVEPIGAVVLKANPEKTVFPLVLDWPVPSTTAETLLVRREGEEIIYLNELRHVHGTALQFRLPVTRPRLIAAMAARGQRGAMEGEDYRGLPVLAAALPVPGTPWILIAKMDQREAYAPINAAAWRARLFAALAILALTGGATYLWHCENAAVLRRSLQNEQRFRMLFERSLDAILLMETDGTIVAANPAACALFGRSAEEICREGPARLIDVSDAATRDLLDARARHGRAQGEMRFLRKDGSAFSAEVSSAVLSTEPGEERASMIIRDITARRASEQALRESEERFRHAVEMAPDAIFIQTRGEFAYVNDAAVRLFGARSADELLGQPILDRFPPDQKEQVRQRIREVNEQRRAVPLLEEKGLRLDGTAVHAEIAAVPFIYRGEHGALVFARDASIRREAEMRLRESENRYRYIFQDSHAVMFLFDPATGEVVDVNPAACAFYGWSREAFLRMHIWDISVRPAEVLKEAMRNVSEEGVAAFESQHRRADCTVRDVEVFSGPMVFGGRRLLFSIVHDITARRVAERTIRLHVAALEAAGDAIILCDRLGNIEWANPAFTTLSGWSLEEARGRNPRELVKSGQHETVFYREMWETLERGQVWRGEIVNRRKDGAFRTENMTITPLRDERGEISHFIAIKQDITEEKRMELRSLHAQRMEAIGTLAGGIAHDLNNILAPTVLIAGVLKDRVPDEKDRELLTIMREGAQRGGAIIRQLLTFSRGVEGQRVTVQIRHVVREIMVIMRETFPRQIELQHDVPTGLPEVSGDPTQLHQVLLNLCLNARDAMPEGGRLLLRAAEVHLSPGSTELPPELAPGRFVRLEVSDTGHGIPPEVRRRIFDPFFTTKPIGQGTGLGLSTVQGIVHSHDGFITVDTELGRGSTFAVYLPADAGLDTAAIPSAEPETKRGAGQLILVVDDETHVRETIRIVLQIAGYRVVTAVDGQDGLNLYRQHQDQVRLVLTDVMMPVMSGTTLVKELRALDAHLPVIISSGLGEFADKNETALIESVAVIAKPFTDTALLELLERELKGAPICDQ